MLFAHGVKGANPNKACNKIKGTLSVMFTKNVYTKLFIHTSYYTC